MGPFLLSAEMLYSISFPTVAVAVDISDFGALRTSLHGVVLYVISAAEVAGRRQLHATDSLPAESLKSPVLFVSCFAAPPLICLQAICNGDYLRPLRLEVWDWDRDGSHELMGRVTTSLQGLLDGQGHEMNLEVNVELILH